MSQIDPDNPPKIDQLYDIAISGNIKNINKQILRYGMILKYLENVRKYRKEQF